LFRRAIVRPPGANFADGLTSSQLGAPDLELAQQQHEAYCNALEECGVALTRLPADPSYPDSTFVEDTAVLTSRFAILARPGAPSRLGEVAQIADTVSKFFDVVQEIRSPGTLDGGDICEAGTHFFIGVSQRTNEEGARQLARFLTADGYTASTVDIHSNNSILHLKSGIAYLDRNNLVVMEELAGSEEFSSYNRIIVSRDESYACNCVLVNDRVLMPAGFPRIHSELVRHGYKPLPLAMSEFRKMDGGLSCLSLRF
jgi:dimethylargininase